MPKCYFFCCGANNHYPLFQETFKKIVKNRKLKINLIDWLTCIYLINFMFVPT